MSMKGMDTRRMDAARSGRGGPRIQAAPLLRSAGDRGGGGLFSAVGQVPHRAEPALGRNLADGFSLGGLPGYLPHPSIERAAGERQGPGDQGVLGPDEPERLARDG